MNKYLNFLNLIFVLLNINVAYSENWYQGAGPNGNWFVKSGKAPIKWSVSKGENILWRTSLPESGQSSVVVWGDRLFVTTNLPWDENSIPDSEEMKKGPMGTDIIGYCLDANTGEILWKVTLPGTRLKLYGGPFSDSTMPSPITDGKYVWFYNVSGMIACFDFNGTEIWTYSWTPRGLMANRQFEPMLVGDVILNVEVKDKSKIINKRSLVDIAAVKSIKSAEGDDHHTFIHAYDKLTGKLKWISEASTSTHSASSLGRTKDGKLALLHSRGGGHHPVEAPKGLSLTSLEPGSEGKTIWTYELNTSSGYLHQWNSDYVTWWKKDHHIVLNASTGELVREQNLVNNIKLTDYNEDLDEYMMSKDLNLNISKKNPTTHYSNLLVGEHHYFRAFLSGLIGRVHLSTGITEYLKVPLQVVRSMDSEEELLWKRLGRNDTKNSRGLDVGYADKRSKGDGWGHISAAPPIAVGSILYIPTMVGTVYVIDTSVKELNEKALLAINDSGPARQTWSLSSLSYSNGQLYHRTMKEIYCIGSK